MEHIVGLADASMARPRPAPRGFEGDKLDDAIRDLITNYHSLNTSTVTILDEEPSPLEFMRYVATNRPFVIRQGAGSWRTCQWSTSYLKSKMGEELVNVAMTPYGNADSVLEISQGDGEEPLSLFVKPYETTEPFSEVIETIRTQEIRRRAREDPKERRKVSSSPDSSSSPVRYLQTQNDNLRNEYAKLFSDVPSSIPFAHIALQRPPDAINFWLGNSYSTTALHKDNYENIYVQVLGKKHFVLIPPVEAACVNEKACLSATYKPTHHDPTSATTAGEFSSELVPHVDGPDPTYVSFCTWDPDTPDRNPTPFSPLSRPLRVTLEAGDMLYLPALWYHKVEQSCNEEGISCSVNYWYDMSFDGGLWSMAGFVRGVGLIAGKRDGGNNIGTKIEKP